MCFSEQSGRSALYSIVSGIGSIPLNKQKLRGIKMLNFKKTTLAISVGFALGIGVTHTANAYNTLNILGNLGSETSNTRPNAVNDFGQVVGSSNQSAVIWYDTIAKPLYGTGLVWTSASGINNLGQVSGTGTTPRTQYYQGTQKVFLWEKNKPTVIMGDGRTYGGINDKGQVVGDTAERAQHATLWNGTTPTILDPTTINPNSTFPKGTYAFDINDAGQVLGMNTSDQSVIWDGATTTVLNGLFGYRDGSTNARAINNLGQVVGNSFWDNDSSYISQAILWDGSSPKVLQGLSKTTPVLSGMSGNDSHATDINDKGLVIGVSNDDFRGYGRQQAVLWSGTSVINLNSLVDPSLGLWLNNAIAINNNGLIVGTAIDSMGRTVAYKLSVADMQLSPAIGFAAPVPEPSTYAMLLAGMGMIGWTARRRKTNI